MIAEEKSVKFMDCPLQLKLDVLYTTFLHVSLKNTN
jgi:hypothetical protein